jgi:WD repeat-containing protein 35
VATGKIIKDGNVLRCKTCKHLSITPELKGNPVCGLCHSALQAPGAAARPGATAGRSQGGYGNY